MISSSDKPPLPVSTNLRKNQSQREAGVFTSEALARTAALTRTAPALLTTGAKRTEAKAGLEADRHSMSEAATTAALEPATAMVVDAIAWIWSTLGLPLV